MTTLSPHTILCSTTNTPSLLEQSGNHTLLLLRQTLRHHDRNHDVQIALLTGELVHRNALALHLQHLARLRNSLLPELHAVSVQVRHVAPPAQQRVLQRNAVVHPQVVIVACEGRVLALLKNHHHVARIQIGMLVALVLERDLLSVLHAALNVHRDRVRLRHQLPTVTHVTRLVKGLSLASALLARLLDLLHKTGSQLNALQNEARSLAHGTSMHVVRIIGARSVAVLTELLTVERERLLASVVQLLQCDRNCRLHILVSLLASKSSKSKDITEWVEALLTIVLFSLFHTFLSLNIVHTSLVLVGETVVGRLNVDELRFTLLRFTLVWMVLQTQLSIGLLDL